MCSKLKPGPIVSTAQIKAGGDGNGLTLFDPGYINTAPVKSSISYIDGDKGILRYRGYPIEDLAEKSTFLETAYLLRKFLPSTLTWKKLPKSVDLRVVRCKC